MTKIAEIVQPSGVLNQSNADFLREEVISIINRGVKIILVDFQDVTFMTSSGIGALVAALKAVQSAGGEFYICSLSEQAQTIFELTKIGRIFHPFADRQEFEDKVLAAKH